MSYRTEDIRNIAIAGHGGTGKTSLVEQLLYAGGQIPRPEPVSSGKSVSDFTEEEIEHGISIHTSLSHIFWKQHKINILDSPGSADFVGEAVAAFRTAESAVMVVDAQAGVQIETIKLWRRLDRRNKPRIVFINKMDGQRADFQACLADLREKFGRDEKPFIPVAIPVGAGNDFRGVIDLLTMKAWMLSQDGERESETSIPPDLLAEATTMHESMIEAAAVGDDQLLAKFLETEDLTLDEAVLGLSEGLAANKLVPVFCGSAEHSCGIASFLDFLTIAAPAPTGIEEVGYNENHQEQKIAIDRGVPFSAFSFKTSIDQYAGKLSYLKVITGHLRPDSEILNVRSGKRERISKIYMAQGRKLEEVDEIFAGDLGIVAKIASAHTNDSFCLPDNYVEYRPLQLPSPVYSLAVSAESKKDVDRLSEILTKALEEDKTLALAYNEETRETVLSGMGDLHLSLLFEKAFKTAKITVISSTPKVAYREAMTQSAEAEFTHKKQSGGHGQYAKVLMKFSPLERGAGFEFVNEIHGGSVSRGYMPGIEKGLLEGMEQGVVAGYPVVDLKAVIYDGKEHPVDSSEMAFKLAARGALKEALAKGRCTLLEPVMTLTVFVEENCLGDILSDLSAKRGRVLGQNALGGGIVEVSAEVPQAELLRYAIDLKSMTSGTGSFELAFAYYSPISGRIADEVIAAAAAAPERAQQH